jgi:hypothetical protein
MSRTAGRIVALFFFLTVPCSLALDLKDPSEYLGTWEILIANSGTTFRACCLNLERKDERLRGEMVWRWGSVWRIPDGALSLGEKGELLIKNNEWASPLTVRRVGDSLEGSVQLKEGTFYVYGTRGEEVVNVQGTWDMTLKTSEGEHKGVVKLLKDDGGAIRVEAYNAEGKKVELRDVEVTGNSIRFTFIPDDSAAGAKYPSLQGEVRGDRIVGKVTLPDRGEAPVEGVRRRKFGPPLKLLAENGLAGWGPREKIEKFGWKCEGGVLTNSDKGDIDIVSSAKFQDFQLHLEYKVVKGGNSGVYLRGRYEVQIQDDHGKPVEEHTNGAVYSRIIPSVNACKPAETWQTYDIALTGRWLTVKLNGVTIIDNVHLNGITGGAKDPYESTPGPLMLQGDHGKIWFRDITVTPALSD